MVVITRQLFSPTITLNFFSAGLVFPCHWIKTWAVSFTLRVNMTLHFLDEQTSKVQELAKWFHAAQGAEGPGLFPAHQAALTEQNILLDQRSFQLHRWKIYAKEP